LVLSALGQFQALLDKGALISVDENSLRARLLPLTEWMLKKFCQNFAKISVTMVKIRENQLVRQWQKFV